MNYAEYILSKHITHYIGTPDSDKEIRTKIVIVKEIERKKQL
jgi:hypothetical protein